MVRVKSVTVNIKAKVMGYLNDGETEEQAQIRIALEVEQRVNKQCDLRMHLDLNEELRSKVLCVDGRHTLLDIYHKSCAMPGEEHVIRWCKNCGVVVVDRDIDGRTQPGAIEKMRFPTAPAGATEGE